MRRSSASLRVVLGVLAVAATVLVGACGWPGSEPGRTPIGSSANGPITFVRSAGREADLVEIDPVTADERVRFAGRGTVSTPAWSADGRRLAYAWRDPTAGGYRIRVADADGSNDRPITPGDAIDASPSWSPSGDRLAFSSNREGPGFGVFVVEVDGSGPVRLVDGQDPAWSPTGEWIAFVRLVDEARDLFLVRPDGSGLRRLTVGPADETDPAWTPDGRSLVFASDRSGDHDLYRLDLDDLQRTRLTSGPGNDRSPAVSPDGRSVAFSRTLGNGADLWLTDDDGRERRLTTDPLYDVDPAWQPIRPSGSG
ncbi:MAG TPA: hypothetical protein VLA23_08960 [Candidatus Limnocylindrales bacterium]|nr:hypothetical protein [Candidatus Limnocylindrales bacterium]